MGLNCSQYNLPNHTILDIAWLELLSDVNLRLLVGRNDGSHCYIRFLSSSLFGHPPKVCQSTCNKLPWFSFKQTTENHYLLGEQRRAPPPKTRSSLEWRGCLAVVSGTHDSGLSSPTLITLFCLPHGSGSITASSDLPIGNLRR